MAVVDRVARNGRSGMAVVARNGRSGAEWRGVARNGRSGAEAVAQWRGMAVVDRVARNGRSGQSGAEWP